MSRRTSRARQDGVRGPSNRLSTSKPSRAEPRRAARPPATSSPTASLACAGRRRIAGGSGKSAAHLVVARPARARKLDEQLRRVVRGRLGELGVDALLPARLRLRAHVVPLAASQHGQRLEVRRLEHHGRRRRRDLACPRRPSCRARPIGRSASAITRSSGSSFALRPVERARASRPDARGARRSGRPRAFARRTRAAGCRARASRSSSTSTTFEIGRMPAPISRAFSQRGRVADRHVAEAARPM